MKNKQFKKDDMVWFVDIYQNKAYPDWGNFEARTTDGRIVIQSHYGLFLLPKEECYFTKEECQEAINQAKEVLKNE